MGKGIFESKSSRTFRYYRICISVLINHHWFRALKTQVFCLTFVWKSELLSMLSSSLSGCILGVSGWTAIKKLRRQSDSAQLLLTEFSFFLCNISESEMMYESLSGNGPNLYIWIMVKWILSDSCLTPHISSILILKESSIS